MGKFVNEKIYQENGYEFVLEFDTGGNPDFPNTIWIYKEGSPLRYNGSHLQIRKSFAAPFNRFHAMNFCRKFAQNENYRNSLKEAQP